MYNLYVISPKATHTLMYRGGSASRVEAEDIARRLAKDSPGFEVVIMKEVISFKVKMTMLINGKEEK